MPTFPTAPSPTTTHLMDCILSFGFGFCFCFGFGFGVRVGFEGQWGEAGGVFYLVLSFFSVFFVAKRRN
jgi:hypothetical protein